RGPDSSCRDGPRGSAKHRAHWAGAGQRQLGSAAAAHGNQARPLSAERADAAGALAGGAGARAVGAASAVPSGAGQGGPGGADTGESAMAGLVGDPPKATPDWVTRGQCWCNAASKTRLAYVPTMVPERVRSAATLELRE